MTFECFAPYLISITSDVEAEDRREAARAFRRKHNRWPSMVGDDFVTGCCEDCGHAIFEDEAVEGIELHRECLEDRSR